jgi:hypothetical protein
MSLLEYFQKLAADLAITTSLVFTNTYKLGATGADIAVGRGQLGIRMIVKSAALVAGTETYELQAVSATASDGTTGQQVLCSTGTISTARAATELAAGQVIDLPIPPGMIPATATHITGKLVTANSAGITVDAYLVDISQMENWTPYPGAITVIN